MRLISKYKNFIFTNKISTNCPLKILKFHRTKWKKLQKLIKHSKRFTFSALNFNFKTFIKKREVKLKLFTKLKSSSSPFLKKTFNQKKSFINNLTINVVNKRWFKINRKYAENLKLKRFSSLLFDNSITNSFFKRKLLKKKSIDDFDKKFKLFLIKPFFKIEILLTKLFFFESVYHANQFFREKNILLNGKSVKSNEILKKGDIITFKTFFKILPFIKSYSFLSFFYNFIEIDHYSKTIIIIKDYNDISNHDISLIYKNYLNLKLFVDYFKFK